jgi:hypothetical protein
MDGFGKLKNSIISPGIAPATFRHVSQSLNQPLDTSYTLSCHHTPILSILLSPKLWTAFPFPQQGAK